MRVVLTSNASYDPPRGGSTRSNLAWLRHMAASGHECIVVCPTPPGVDDRVTHDFGVTILGYRDLSMRAPLLGEAIRAHTPDWVLVSSEDVTHVLLREAGKSAPGRLVYLAHTPQFFPFGPESWNPDPAAAALICSARAMVAIGEHMRGYIQRSLDVTPLVVHPPIYGRGPWNRFGRFGSGCVLMVNPCVVKGIEIFLGLADRRPSVEFAALTGWGTTRSDRAALAARPNIRILETVPDIEDVLCQARLLLMPSVWYEGFGLIAMEAMLRGLPVISSDSGGLVEAKRGTGYVISVRPVERYQQCFDDTGMPKAVVPDQDLDPWLAALDRLLTDQAEYWHEAEACRSAAEQFVRPLDAADFRRMLEQLGEPPVAAPQPRPAGGLANLDAARRALLVERLKHRKKD